MSSPVTLYAGVYGDSRFVELAVQAGLTNHYEAIGRMGQVWEWCTENNSAVIPERRLRIILGCANASQALIDSDLGELVEGGIRVKGATEKRIGWKAKLDANKKAAGEARARSAVREGGRFVSEQSATSQSDQQTTSRPPADHQQEPAESSASSPTSTSSPTQERERESGGSSQPALELELAKPESSASPRLARGLELAVAAIAELNQLTSSRYQPDGKDVRTNAATLAKQGYTAEDAIAVIRAKVAEWLPNERMAGQLKPGVLLRPSNFRRYVDDVRGGNGVKARASPKQGRIEPSRPEDYPSGEVPF